MFSTDKGCCDKNCEFKGIDFKILVKSLDTPLKCSKCLQPTISNRAEAVLNDQTCSTCLNGRENKFLAFTGDMRIIGPLYNTMSKIELKTLPPGGKLF
mmetsp:Transcript_20974/g.32515  ORF Transcript_20974/g.32515 Transcript_20974/m.32515 type:complete len:98 (+) Transcript_20974:958-1251(+)